MAATLEIAESNNVAGEVVTVATGSDYGDVDSPNMTATAHPLGPSTNSYEKEHRVHVTALGGSAAVSAFKFYATPPGNATGLAQMFNGHTVQATYDASKRTAFAAPVRTPGNVPNAVPTSEPGSANLGIGGSLTGQLTAAGYSDYLLHQVQVGASPTHTDTLAITYALFYGYTEVL